MTARNDFTVLLVEDSLTQAKQIEGLLHAGNGCKIEVALETTVAGALARLQCGGIDAALLDLELPDATGVAGLDAILNIYPDLPVVVMTAHHGEELRSEALMHGAQDYLLKDGDMVAGILSRSLSIAIERTRLSTINHKLARVIMREIEKIKAKVGTSQALTDTVDDDARRATLEKCKQLTQEISEIAQVSPSTGES